MKLPGALLIPIGLVALAQQVDRKLQNEFDEVSAKAAALISAVNAMEQRARDNGDVLSSEIRERRALLQSSIDRGAEALRANDSAALKEQITRARGHIERLAKMV